MKKWNDQLPGGKADNKNPNNFDQKQLAIGAKHEMEHTNDYQKAIEIAMDHLSEDPYYYEKIKKYHMESKMITLKEFFLQTEDEEKKDDKKKPEKDDSIGKSADRITGNFYKKKDKPKDQPKDDDKPIPSLSQLAKDIDKDKKDDPLKDLPKFDKQPEDPGFDFNDPKEKKPSFLSKVGKGASNIAKNLGHQAGQAVKKGAKTAADKTGVTKAVNKVKDLSMDPDDFQATQAAVPLNVDKQPDKTPDSWKSTKNGMPLLSKMSQQKFGKNAFASNKGTNNWKAGDTVDIGFMKGFKVDRYENNGWIVSRGGKKFKYIGGQLYPL